MLKKSLKLAIAAFLSLVTAEAQATDIQASGVITGISLSGPANYSFRIFVKQNNVDQLSQCTYSFAYMNEWSNDNYNAKVASLLTAFSMGKSIYLYLGKDSSTNFCRIIDFTVYS